MENAMKKVKKQLMIRVRRRRRAGWWWWTGVIKNTKSRNTVSANCVRIVRDGLFIKERLHAYEAISSALSRLSVGNNDRLGDVAERLEVAAQGLVGRVVRQSADEDLREGRVAMMRSAQWWHGGRSGSQSVDTRRRRRTLRHESHSVRRRS